MRGGPFPSSYHNPIKLRRAFGGKDPTRVHTRHPCNVEVTVWSYDASKRLGAGKFTNVGVGGALLHCSFKVEKGTRCQFLIGRGENRAILYGRIVRGHQPERHRPYDLFYGVHFDLSRAQEKELRAGLDQLRHKPKGHPISDDKLKWYWWL